MKDFNYYDFLKLAKQLFHDEKYQSEAAIRTIIGRSYYSVFLHVREFIKDNLEKLDPNLYEEFMQYILPKGVVHSSVRKIIKKLSFKLGYKIAKLSDLRKDADYDLSIIISKQEAEEAIQTAEELMLQVNEELAKSFENKISEVKLIIEEYKTKVKRI